MVCLYSPESGDFAAQDFYRKVTRFFSCHHIWKCEKHVILVLGNNPYYNNGTKYALLGGYLVSSAE